MALFNYATKEITLKIVYYGPGLSGKTTNIQYLHSALNANNKGKLLSLATESDRTLFFDFLPIELGKIKEFSIRFQLYTVPGQVRYNATRKVVLKGADAVVFVADSQRDMIDQNVESFENMRENLIANNINPDEIPVVLQYNKRDLKGILTLDELNADINKKKVYDVVEAEAIHGKGVEDTFQLVTKLVLKEIVRKHKIEIQPAATKEAAKDFEKVPQQRKPEIGTLQFESELQMMEPAGYAFEGTEAVEEPETNEEAIEDLGSVYESAVETQTTVTVQKAAPIQPRLKTEALVGKASYGEVAEETGKSNEPSGVSSEKIIKITDDIARLSSLLSDLKGTADSLKKDILEIKESLGAMNQSSALRDENHLKASRKEHKETRGILIDIASAISDIKVRKSWFRF
jgi:mutual gliding-motility protein MglA